MPAYHRGLWWLPSWDTASTVNYFQFTDFWRILYLPPCNWQWFIDCCVQPFLVCSINITFWKLCQTLFEFGSNIFTVNEAWWLPSCRYCFDGQLFPTHWFLTYSLCACLLLTMIHSCLLCNSSFLDSKVSKSTFWIWIWIWKCTIL
jgi:hypothetical protein